MFFDRSTFLLASSVVQLIVCPEGPFLKKELRQASCVAERCERILVAVLPASEGEGNGEL